MQILFLFLNNPQLTLRTKLYIYPSHSNLQLSTTYGNSTCSNPAKAQFKSSAKQSTYLKYALYVKKMFKYMEISTFQLFDSLLEVLQFLPSTPLCYILFLGNPLTVKPHIIPIRLWTNKVTSTYSRNTGCGLTLYVISFSSCSRIPVLSIFGSKETNL